MKVKKKSIKKIKEPVVLKRKEEVKEVREEEIEEDDSEDKEVERLREVYKKKKYEEKRFSFSIHEKLRMPLVWVLFFSIIGIVQKSIALGRFVFTEFFGRYYIDWFSSFSNFSENYAISSATELLFIIIRDWYYFFLTGGLISLVWAVIYLLIHIKVEKKRDDFDFGVDD
jgi:hypothetical protein